MIRVELDPRATGAENVLRFKLAVDREVGVTIDNECLPCPGYSEVTRIAD